MSASGPLLGERRPLRSLWLGTVAYAAAWELQRSLAASRRSGDIDDCVILLEHPPVYTLGRNTSPEHAPGGADRLRGLGADVHSVDRGGSVTFHGPGQLVAYPIVDLAAVFPVPNAPARGDVGAYLRALEAALCATAAAAGVAAERRPPYTGAWVGDRKLAAIGVKLAAGITQHGIALNVSTDLRWFDEIIPCGIGPEDGGVTSLERIGATGWTPERLAPHFAGELALRLGRVAAEPSAELLRLTRAAPRHGQLVASA